MHFPLAQRPVQHTRIRADHTMFPEQKTITNLLGSFKKSSKQVSPYVPHFLSLLFHQPQGKQVERSHWCDRKRTRKSLRKRGQKKSQSWTRNTFLKDRQQIHVSKDLSVLNEWGINWFQMPEQQWKCPVKMWGQASIRRYSLELQSFGTVQVFFPAGQSGYYEADVNRKLRT